MHRHTHTWFDTYRKAWFDIYIKAWFEGLSIIYITAFRRPKRKVDKSTNQHIYNWSISPMHKRNGLSNPQNETVYRRHTNIPIGIYTLAKGWFVDMPKSKV